MSIMEKKNVVIDIPVAGSLCILALGHQSVLAWRKVRDAAEKEKNEAKKPAK